MILTAIAIGVYLAFTIPVAVFPATDFPRIVVGIDNGVFPIDQMLVTVTRPIEEAVNSVPGLDHLWSITSRYLGPSATADEIAREWPRWHEANRDVIGDDPDLIRPGQVLHPPASSRGS